MTLALWNLRFVSRLSSVPVAGRGVSRERPARRWSVGQSFDVLCRSQIQACGGPASLPSGSRGNGASRGLDLEKVKTDLRKVGPDARQSQMNRR